MSKRRLPIYVIVNTSESMVGKPIHAALEFLESLCDELANDRRLSESAYLSVITYSTQAEQLIDLRSVTTGDFSALSNLPNMVAQGGMPATDDALLKVCECVKRELIPANAQHTGDYSPVLIYLTDRDSVQFNIYCEILPDPDEIWNRCKISWEAVFANRVSDICKIHWDSAAIVSFPNDFWADDALLAIKTRPQDRPEDINLSVSLEDDINLSVPLEDVVRYSIISTIESRFIS